MAGQGKEIDKQVHLGFDLASLQQAAVEASNRGVVLFANYLGIYGNCVIVDHGLGQGVERRTVQTHIDGSRYLQSVIEFGRRRGAGDAGARLHCRTSGAATRMGHGS